MRLQTYRDESRSRHFDLTGGGSHPWSIDLVAATVSGILVGRRGRPPTRSLSRRAS
jgi:hypothetical protein